MTPAVQVAGALRSAEDLARLLADPQRLAIAGHLAVAPRAVATLADLCALSPRTVQRQLTRLVRAGLAHVDGDVARLDADALRTVAASLPRAAPIRPHLLVGLSAEDAEVAARYFEGERLTEIPVAQGRRRAVLRILIDEFEPGRYYSEAEVRRILRKFHPDDAALRRYLVENGLLSRENRSRTYWRSPGPPPRTASRAPID